MKKGFSLLELLLITSVLAVFLTTISLSLYVGYKDNLHSGTVSRAIFLANEGLEGVKNIRDNRFFDLTDGVYDLITSNGAWTLTPFVESPGGALQRKITITTIDATPSQEKKEVKVEILQWKRDCQGGIQVTLNIPKTFLSNLLPKAKAVIVGDDDSPPPPGCSSPTWVSSILVSLTTRFANWTPTVVNWSQPTAGGIFDFNSQNSGSNSHDARAVIVAGNYLYVGNKSSAAKEFIVLSIADTPSLSILGTIDLSGSPQRMAAGGDYVYIASDDNSQELQVIDVKNKQSPFLAAGFDLTSANSGDSNTDANSIAVWGNYVFLGRKIDPQNNFFIFDVGAGANCSPVSPCLISQLQILNASRAFDPQDIKISADGNYAYVVTDHGKFFRINTSNKASPFIDGVEVSTHDGGNYSLAITNSRAYVGTPGVTGAGPSVNEIYTIDISNPSVNPSLLSSFNLGDNGVDVKSLSFAADVRYLIVLTSDTSKEFQVVNVSNDLSPSLVGTLDLLSVVQAADWSFTYYTEYVVGQVSTAEIQMVNPQLIY